MFCRLCGVSNGVMLLTFRDEMLKIDFRREVDICFDKIMHVLGALFRLVYLIIQSFSFLMITALQARSSDNDADFCENSDRLVRQWKYPYRPSEILACHRSWSRNSSFCVISFFILPDHVVSCFVYNLTCR